MSEKTLSGNYTSWELFDNKRKYGTVQNLPFSEAQEYIMAVRYNGVTGKGNQRELVESHVRKLKKELETGNFTPTNVSASCSSKHIKSLVYHIDSIGNDTFHLKVNSDDPLLHTDGGHRYEALNLIIKDLTDKVEKATQANDTIELEKYTRWLNQAKNLPITVTVYFDGNPQQDFINLQAGKPADASHMLSLRLQHGVLNKPEIKLAFEIAKLLHKETESPLHNQIRFDSRGKLPMPINSLCAVGPSDLSSSLIGLAKIGLHFKQDAKTLANFVVKAYTTLQEKAPELLEYGRVITPLSNQGAKGSMTVLVGTAMCLAYRTSANGRSAPDESDLTAFIDSAKITLNEKTSGNLSSQGKRILLNRFATHYLNGLSGSFHEGLPLELLKILSCSAYGVKPIKKDTVFSLHVPSTVINSDISDEIAPWEAAKTVNAEVKAPWEQNKEEVSIIEG